MEFVIRDVDPPGWNFALVVGLLLALGAVVGLVSIAVRLARRRVRLRDGVVWAVGASLGFGLGLVSDNQVSSAGFLGIAACMGAGVWIATRSSSPLRTSGVRLIEGAAITTIVAFWIGRP
jgi:hypothetical protein